ncbi:cutinase family protein [Actinokineospora sp. G85]|uniref:cutinase family protein n=1 Tax=Actinokineospora sp. G85 TaxID=3406626 RepID=UPI003C734965
MRLAKAFGAALAAGALLFTITPSGTAAPQGTLCKPLHVYAVRGSEEVGPYGRQIAPVVDELRRLRPGLVSAQGNGYPAVVWELSWGRPDLVHTYAESVRDGVRRMRSDLAALKSYCPRSKIAVIGYSQGSDVVRRALADEAPDPRVRVQLLADPNFTSDDPNLPMVNEAHQIIDRVTGLALGINHLYFGFFPENPIALGKIPAFPRGWSALSVCWRKDPACGGGLGGLPFRWGDGGAHTEYHQLASELAGDILWWSGV